MQIFAYQLYFFQCCWIIRIIWPKRIVYIRFKCSPLFVLRRSNRNVCGMWKHCLSIWNISLWHLHFGRIENRWIDADHLSNVTRNISAYANSVAFHVVLQVTSYKFECGLRSCSHACFATQHATQSSLRHLRWIATKIANRFRKRKMSL